MSFFEGEITGPCQNCGQRPATTRYAAGSLEATHGMWSRWCEACVKAAQREHALKCLPALTTEDLEGELERRLTEDRRIGEVGG